MNSIIPTVLGRLLAELSWEGSKITSYREGGRGYENVLTTEVLQALDFLPRTSFLGHILRTAHGGCPRRIGALCQEIEEAKISVLPGDMILASEDLRRINVQPDAIISSPSVHCVLEAKRIRSSSFQPLQLAREFMLALRNNEGKQPLLLLFLSTPPPVLIQGKGRLSIYDAIVGGLPEVLIQGADCKPFADLIANTVLWLTWPEIAAVVSSSAGAFSSGNPSIDASIQRVTSALLAAIEWHGEEAIRRTP